MKLFAFVFWMLGWPALFTYGNKPDVTVSNEASIVFLGIWIIVGILVYEKV